MSFSFSVEKSSESQARVGKLSTPHGVVKTPSYVTVGTKATIKALAPEDLEYTGTQLIFANTYHLVLSPGADTVNKAGGVHAFSHINKPMISDSGGFQVFSLGTQHAKDASITKKDAQSVLEWDEKQTPSKVKITEEGVAFRSHIDGTKITFTSEFSIDAQKKIGADLILAFDEDILYKASRTYTERSTERTHRWLDRCIKEFKKKTSYGGSKTQRLYGIIHGGRFEDVRKASTQYVLDTDVWGIALGGVSVGIDRKELLKELNWTSEILGDDPRPRHLLGITTLHDVIYAVERGFDTFDSVLPTRYARVGKLYDMSFDRVRASKFKKDTAWTIDITKKKFANDMSPVVGKCGCHTCQHYTKAYINHLFRQRELLAYRLATIHNLYAMERFFADMRQAIKKNEL